MSFQESFDLPINIRNFYLENISEELKEKQEEKNSLLKMWQKTGSAPPISIV